MNLHDKIKIWAGISASSEAKKRALFSVFMSLHIWKEYWSGIWPHEDYFDPFPITWRLQNKLKFLYKRRCNTPVKQQWRLERNSLIWPFYAQEAPSDDKNASSVWPGCRSGGCCCCWECYWATWPQKEDGAHLEICFWREAATGATAAAVGRGGGCEVSSSLVL